jgi:hypothetical protein
MAELAVFYFGQILGCRPIHPPKRTTSSRNKPVPWATGITVPCLFILQMRIDARLVFNEDSIATGVSNLVTGGLHTTESQLEARNSLTRQSAGLHLTAGRKRYGAG